MLALEGNVLSKAAVSALQHSETKRLTGCWQANRSRSRWPLCADLNSSDLLTDWCHTVISSRLLLLIHPQHWSQQSCPISKTSKVILNLVNVFLDVWWCHNVFTIWQVTTHDFVILLLKKALLHCTSEAGWIAREFPVKFNDQVFYVCDEVTRDKSSACDENSLMVNGFALRKPLRYVTTRTSEK